MLYSLSDFQQALSAASFLEECDPDAHITRKDLWRFKCYETTLVVAYMRPFSQSRGAVPRLTLDKCGIPLSEELLQLHSQLQEQRDKVFAHSDGDLMRMVVKTHGVEVNGTSLKLLGTAYDEGLHLIGPELWKVRDLINTVHQGIYAQLLAEAQQQPELYNFRKDYRQP